MSAQEAVGMLMVIAVSERVSPVFIVTLADRVIAAPYVPDVDADQYDVAVTTSPLVPAQLVQLGRVPFAEMLAPEALAHVTALRVVVLDTFDVPAEPGAPVCSCAHAMFVPVMLPSAELATVVETPSATAQPSVRWSMTCVITCERRMPQVPVQWAVGCPITFAHGCPHPVQA
jgi:hypothetical protein